jgi:hypothetical protein
VAPDALLAAFEERTKQATVAAAPVSHAAASVALADGIRAGACRRAAESEEVL